MTTFHLLVVEIREVGEGGSVNFGTAFNIAADALADERPQPPQPPEVPVPIQFHAPAPENAKGA